MKPHLYIIRGLPGSGKTTFAETLLSSGVISSYHEADQYMVDESGNYYYDAGMLGLCHNSCRVAATLALKQGKSVAIYNTTTTKRELDALINIANSCGASYSIIRMSGMFGSIHNVPQEVIDKMRNRFYEPE